MSETPTNPFVDMINDMVHEMALTQAQTQFEQGIVVCMRDEGLNLEAAIATVRDHLKADYTQAGVSKEQFDTALHVFEHAVDRVHTIFATARELIGYDERGSAVPLPYDATKAKAARDKYEQAHIANLLRSMGTGPN